MMCLGTLKSGVLRGPFFMAVALACAAIAAPALLPVGAPPLLSLYTEAIALLCWGLWLAWLAPRLGGLRLSAQRLTASPLAAALLVLVVSLASVLLSVAALGLPVAIGVRHTVILCAAVLALLAGARLAGLSATLQGQALSHAALLGFLVAGLGSAAIAVAQYFAVDGPWERLGKDGRAGGNLAQPNLLGTQLLWAYAALVALRARQRLGRTIAWLGAALLLLAVAMSASRSAALGCLVLALWGALDRRLSRETRGLLLAAPVALMVAWGLLTLWPQVGGPGFAGTGLLHKADPTSSRWRLWQQCARLIAEHPWAGVGWGQFNFAWSLTPMPGLPRTVGYTFSHAHNIVLQWAVELGLPLALLLVGVLGFALLRTAQRLWRRNGDSPADQRAALAMVLVVILHSQFEFPLWHTNFLLPTVFLLGLAVGSVGDVAVPVRPSRNASAAPLLLALAAAWALLDYRPIVAVYLPPADAAPLAQRIATAQQSWLFGQFADRFAGTLAKPGARALNVYTGAAFELVDLRLLASWAQALAEHGQIDKARFLAARLAEFESPPAKLFFAPCQAHPEGFQCSANAQHYGFANFR